MIETSAAPAWPVDPATLPWLPGEGLQGVAACRDRAAEASLTLVAGTRQMMLVDEHAPGPVHVATPDLVFSGLEQRVLTFSRGSDARTVVLEPDDAVGVARWLDRAAGRELGWTARKPGRPAAEWRAACFARRLGLLGEGDAFTIGGSRILLGRLLAARVSVSARPASIPAMRALEQLDPSVRLMFTTCGYLDPGLGFALEHDIALFRFDSGGLPRAVNARAEALVTRRATAPRPNPSRSAPAQGAADLRDGR